MNKTQWQIAQYFEIKWWQRYLKRKNVTQYLSWKANYWINLLEQFGFKAEQFTGNVADIGCGPAGIFIVLKQAQITAIDPLINQYKTLAHFKPNAYPNVVFENSSFETSNVKAEFDFIFCLNAINHFTDINASVNKLNQLLKPNGQMLISFDTHNYGILKRLFKTLPFLDILHPYQNDLAGYHKLLKQHGFSIKKTVRLTKRTVFDYNICLVSKA